MDLDTYSEKSGELKTSLVKSRTIPHLSTFERTLRALRPGERLLLHILVVIFALSALVLLAGANAAVSVAVPTHGGTLTEGVVGPARFINPLIALSEPDRNLAALVYSGLMRATPEGNLVPDLAASYKISEDGTTYTFTLRKNLTFHDGSPVTAEDVAFTIQRAQNPDIKSARRADWEGVTVSIPDAHTIVFALPHPYAPFLENATVGILPKHLWENVSPEEFLFTPLNTRPVGSGPYRLVEIKTSATGAAERCELESFRKFALGEPYLSKIFFLFFPNEEALISAYNGGRVESFAGLSPSELKKINRKNTYIVHVPLPRIFGVFFNQNKNSALADSAVRAALDAAIDKQKIVDDVLKGYAAILRGPIPPGVLGTVSPAIPHLFMQNASVQEQASAHAEKARSILTHGGWKFDEAAGVWKKKNAILQLTLSTANDPELSETAEAIASTWQRIGIKTDVHMYPLSELNTAVLRPRNYEAVLFGEVVGRTLDLFAFWHSSQRNDPGLNLALYTNSKVDGFLSHARAATNERDREKLYRQFAETVVADQPAIFLYAPEFIYIVPPALKGIELGPLTTPAERFLNVYEWYFDTKRVWNIFTSHTDTTI